MELVVDVFKVWDGVLLCWLFVGFLFFESLLMYLFGFRLFIDFGWY